MTGVVERGSGPAITESPHPYEPLTLKLTQTLKPTPNS